MKSRIFVVATLLCLLMGVDTFAQMQGPRGPRGPRGPLTIEQRVNRRTERMQEQFGLSDEQAAKIYAIQLEYAKQQQVLLQQMQALRMAEAEQMKAVLTPEQFEQWQESQQRMGQGGRPYMRQGAPMRDGTEKPEKQGKSEKGRGGKKRDKSPN